MPPRWLAAVFFVGYLAAATVPKGGILFARFPIFFPDLTPDVLAMPAFLVDGRPASVRRCRDFVGIPASAVVRSVPDMDAWHRFMEQRQWIAAHQAAPGSAPGPARCQVGFWIVSRDASGRPEGRFQASAEGTARCR